MVEDHPLVALTLPIVLVLPLKTSVVENYKDFAFSDYARVGRALALYEIGDKDEAIAEMEDVSISLKGYPEVHAALAAALYVDKHAPLLAENQFTIATLLDPHYTDLSYVKETKHWPPSLVSSLQRFITLS
uniref:Tetratricopeptide repeat protein n=1 Tax=Manihot esculenta TaxID=3983 RepID=A0A2C9URF9_MANES